MELTAFENGEIVFSMSGGGETRYSRVVSNQLILCARMNDWEHFTNLWKKKTEPESWTRMEATFAELDSSKRWKIKEAFARLATTEEDVQVPIPAVVKTVTL